MATPEPDDLRRDPDDGDTLGRLFRIGRVVAAVGLAYLAAVSIRPWISDTLGPEALLGLWLVTMAALVVAVLFAVNPELRRDVRILTRRPTPRRRASDLGDRVRRSPHAEAGSARR